MIILTVIIIYVQVEFLTIKMHKMFMILTSIGVLCIIIKKLLNKIEI